MKYNAFLVMWAMMGLDQLFFVWKSFLIRCFSDWHNSSNPLRQCHPKNHTRKLFLFFYEDISDNKWLLSILWCEYNFFFDMLREKFQNIYQSQNWTLDDRIINICSVKENTTYTLHVSVHSDYVKNFDG